MDYYDLPQISNSDLTLVEHLLKGVLPSKPQRAFHFGRVFHELLLEPEKFQSESCRTLDVGLLYQMQRTVLANVYCQELLRYCEREKVILWQEPNTSTDCKCKLDIVQGVLVADIKTTSARNLRSFTNCCKAYNYDRQMAFYADSVGAQRVCLIGVSKKSKRLFFVHKSVQGQFIQEGRKKYQYLLQKVKDLDLFEQIYYMRVKNSEKISSIRRCKDYIL